MIKKEIRNTGSKYLVYCGNPRFPSRPPVFPIRHLAEGRRSNHRNMRMGSLPGDGDGGILLSTPYIPPVSPQNPPGGGTGCLGSGAVWARSRRGDL